MASKSKNAPNKCASSHSKNVTPIDFNRQSHSKEYHWEQKLVEFLTPLSKQETQLLIEFTQIICKRATKPEKPCQIIEFVKEKQ